jgi:hypothetical protein
LGAGREEVDYEARKARKRLVSSQFVVFEGSHVSDRSKRRHYEEFRIGCLTEHLCKDLAEEVGDFWTKEGVDWTSAQACR